jgi:hypothetical protein
VAEGGEGDKEAPGGEAPAEAEERVDVALERAGDEEDVRLRRRRRRDAFLPAAHGVATGEESECLHSGRKIVLVCLRSTLVHFLGSWLRIIYRADS